MILRSHQRRSFQCRSRQAAAALSLAVVLMLAGCQSTDGVVWRMNLQQPGEVTQRPDDSAARSLSAQPASHPSLRRAIRPGHSFDVDHGANTNEDNNVRLVAASRAEDESDRSQEAAFGHESLPGYPIPPPPAPLNDAPEQPTDANLTTGPHDGRSLPIGFGFLRRSLSGEDRDRAAGDGAARDVMAQTATGRDTTDTGPQSPKLASPFSLRRLYEKLRPKKHETAAPADDGRASETSTRVCEYNEFDPAAPDAPTSPVALGLPDTTADDNLFSAGHHRSAVTQACPSNFHQPLYADPSDVEKYTPE